MFVGQRLFFRARDQPTRRASFWRGRDHQKDSGLAVRAAFTPSRARAGRGRGGQILPSLRVDKSGKPWSVDVLLLIDQIVRQTTVLIAQLATTSGARAPLSHVAGQVFYDLTKELRAQGLGNKLIADMFGMALRTYRERVRRLSESSTERGTTLWEATLKFVEQRRIVTRADVLRRFGADDPQSVRAVLSDLVKSGLLYRSGRGDATTYRAAQLDESVLPRAAKSEQTLLDAAWVLLHQQGPTTAPEMAALLRTDQADANELLHALVEMGRARLERIDGDHEPRFVVDHCVIPIGASAGWEAALLDHFQAVVTTMINKVAGRTDGAKRGAATGGSTYHFDLYAGHPDEAEVLNLIEALRTKLSELRNRARAYPPPSEQRYRVTFYLGQDVRDLSGETEMDVKS